MLTQHQRPKNEPLAEQGSVMPATNKSVGETNLKLETASDTGLTGWVPVEPHSTSNPSANLSQQNKFVNDDLAKIWQK